MNLTAVVTGSLPGSGTPTGTVDFVDAITNTDLGTARLSNGTAALTGIYLAAGNHTVVADYSGDQTFQASMTLVGPGSPISLIAGNGTTGYSGDNVPATMSSLNYPTSTVVDSSGHLFIADSANQRVREVDRATGIITTVAGNGIAGYSGDGGPATAAELSPSTLAVDNAGHLFIADSNHEVVREVTLATGVITTVAGNGTKGYGGDGGPATAAELDAPAYVTVDNAGHLFIADTNNHRLREVDLASGTITAIAGKGTSGDTGDGGPATAAELSGPGDIAADASGHLFVIDGSTVRQIDLATGIISTIAGNGTAGYGGDGGPATAAMLDWPVGLAVDPAGELFIAEYANHLVRKVDLNTGIISTIAGLVNQGKPVQGYSGDGGPATAAELNGPYGISVDLGQHLFIADIDSNAVREVDFSSGVITTVAGGYSGDGGPASSASLAQPAGLAADASGQVFITEPGNDRVREVDPLTGTITTVADSSSRVGALGQALGLGNPSGVAVDGAGHIFIPGYFTSQVYELDPATGAITTVAGDGTYDSGGDGGPATAGQLKAPWDVAVDNAGHLFIADWDADRVREVNLATGIITTVATLTMAPHGLAVDNAGHLFISTVSEVLEVDLASGIITTVAGGGTSGLGDGGQATAAELNDANGIAVDNSGHLFIADSSDHRIREVDLASGIITTMAGTGTAGYSGIGGPAGVAELSTPVGLAVDGSGSLFVSDTTNNRVLEIPSGVRISVTKLSATVAVSAHGGAYNGSRFVASASVTGSNVQAASSLDGVSPAVTYYVGTSTTSGGYATLPRLAFPPRQAGTYTVVGSYPGTYHYDAAVSSPVTLTIAKAPPIVTVKDAGGTFNGGAFPASAAVAGVVSGSDSTPYISLEGVEPTLTYYAGASAAGPGSTAPPVAAGVYTVVASFPGSTDYLSAQSSPVTFTILPALAAVMASAAGGPYTGEPYQANASVAGVVSGVDSTPAATLEGVGTTLTYYAGTSGKGLGSSSPPSAPGIYSAVASFGGSADYAAAKSSPAVFQITASGTAPSRISLVALPSVFIVGSLVTLTATVSALGSSGDIPTGSVDFVDTATGADLGTAALSAGTATLNVPNLAVGAHTITATYLGDSHFQASAAGAQSTSRVSTVAGNGDQGYSGDGGPATAAALYYPQGVAVDHSGHLFIVDQGNNAVREVDLATGNITTIAGNGTSGFSGDGGPATAAALNCAGPIAVDNVGHLFVMDNERVREVDLTTGIITTVAGNGASGFSGDGGPATAAELNRPAALAVDGSGDLFIADQGNARVREVNLAMGTISTVAGNGTSGFSGDGGPATSAELGGPTIVGTLGGYYYYPGLRGLSVDDTGHLFVADTSNMRVREVDLSTGLITTVAGNGTEGFGGDGGPAASAEFEYPASVVVDHAGHLFIADTWNLRIRQVDLTTGIITTMAGTSGSGYTGDGGPAALTQLSSLGGLALDAAGDLFVSTGGNRLHFLSAGALVTVNSTKAVPSVYVSDSSGVYNGGPFTAKATAAGVQPGVDTTPAPTLDGVRPTFAYYVGNTATGRGTALAPVDPGTYTVVASFPGSTLYQPAQSYPLTFTIAAGAPTLVKLSASSTQVLTGRSLTITATVVPAVVPFEGVPSGTTAVFGTPTGTADFFDNTTNTDLGSATLSGGIANLSISTLGLGNHTIVGRYSGDADFHSSVSAAGPSSIITTVAGTSRQGFAGDGGAATEALLSQPNGLAVDAAGDLFIADTANNRVREVSAATGVMTTIAGNGTAGDSGDGGQATAAELNFPYALAVDNSGHLFIADVKNNRIREVDLASGVITTVAGNGTAAYAGDGGPATAAALNYPSGVAVDQSGHLFIADEDNCRIREVFLATGVITTVAGNGTPGTNSTVYSVGRAIDQPLNYPSGVAVDDNDHLFVGSGLRVDLATGLISPSLVGQALALDNNGDLYGVQTGGGNSLVAGLSLFPSQSSSSVQIAGGPTDGGYSGDGSTAFAALISPSGVTIDGSGNLFVSDANDNVIRRITSGLQVTIVPLPAAALPTSVGLSCSANPASPLVMGQPITFMATINPLGLTQATPGGTVDFYDTVTGTDLGAVAVSGGSASIITSALALGNHAIVATYSGDANFQPSTTTIGPDSRVVLVAGNGTHGQVASGQQATEAALGTTAGLASDGHGHLFIADGDNEVVEVTLATGMITIVAGGGTRGLGDGGQATIAELSSPQGIAVDGAGHLFIADFGNYRVREVNLSTGIITTVAGNGTYGYSGDGGLATNAELARPAGLALDGSGHLFIADDGNQRVRELDLATGTITTVAGNGNGASSTGDGGPATAAGIPGPNDVFLDASGHLFIVSDSRVRQVDLATGIISTVAGGGLNTGDGEQAVNAWLDYAGYAAVDSFGHLFINQPSTYGGSANDNAIREVDLRSGIIGTLVSGRDLPVYAGDNGPIAHAIFDNPTYAVFDSTGNLFIADSNDGRVREVIRGLPVTVTQFSSVPTSVSISASATSLTIGQTVALTAIVQPLTYTTQIATGTVDFVDAVTGTDLGTAPLAGGIATLTTRAVAVGKHEAIAKYSGDANFQASVTTIGPSSIISTIAGNGTDYTSANGDGGPAIGAQLNPGATGLDNSGALAVDNASHAFVVDAGRIREIDLGTGTITTVAGDGTYGYRGDGGPATAAEIGWIDALAIDNAGHLFLADGLYYRIREVDLNTGLITTVAGNGFTGYTIYGTTANGDGGLATQAPLGIPAGLAVDNAGHLFISEGNPSVVREVNLATGRISTIAGNGTYGYTGDGGPASESELYGTGALAADNAGHLFILDSGNRRVREVDLSTGIITTVAGGGTSGLGDGGQATAAEILSPTGLTVDNAGHLFFLDYGTEAPPPMDPGSGSSDTYNYLVRQVDLATGIITTVSGSGATGFTPDGSVAASGPMTTSSIAMGPGNQLYLVDNGLVRRVDLATDVLTTVAGGGTNPRGDGYQATLAGLGYNDFLATDNSGHLFISDTYDQRIREVDLKTGIITTVAGNGTAGFSGDGGPATAAELAYPGTLAVDNAGHLFIADFGNQRVREVNLATGIITTVAGNGTATHTPDGGQATNGLYGLSNIAIDSAGHLLVAEQGDVRQVDLVTGIITTVSNVTGLGPISGNRLFQFGETFAGFNAGWIEAVDLSTGALTTIAGTKTFSQHSGDGGQAINAEMVPGAIAVDNAGNLLVTDNLVYYNNESNLNISDIRRINLTTGVITRVAGNGTDDDSGDGAAAGSAGLYAGAVGIGPGTFTVDSAGNVYFVNGQRVRRIASGVDITVNPLGTWSTPTLNVTAAGGTYDGSSFSATIAGTDGVFAPKLEGISPTLMYYSGTTTSGNGSSTAPTAGGTYTVVATFGGSPHYAAAQSQPLTFTIAPSASLTPTVHVTDAGGIYDGSVFPATATVAGSDGVFGPSLEGVSPTLTYYVGSTVSGTGSSTAPTSAGTYTVVASFAGSVDYSAVQSTPLTFTISPAALTIKADDDAKTYGQTLSFAGTEFSDTGLVNGDAVTGVTLTSAGAAAAATVVGSPYSIVPSAAVGSGMPNYTITYFNGNLTVNPASLVVTADNQTMPSGGPLPPLTVSYQGFVNGETAANLTTLPTVSTTATVASPAGTYPIAASGAVDPNYSIRYAAGTMTVTSPSGEQINGTGLQVMGYEFTPLSSVAMATFTVSGGTNLNPTFSAVINWGDGTTSTGTVAPPANGSNGTYTVTGTHSYSDEGVYPVSVVVSGAGVLATIATQAKIHEQLLAEGTVGTPNQNWVQEIYRDLFNRQAEPQGRDYWVAKLNAGETRAQVALEIVRTAAPEESQRDAVEALYETYLSRPADPAGLNYWIGLLYDGVTSEQIAAAICGSAEYYQKYGENDGGYLNALFEDALNRPIDPQARSYFEAAMAKGVTAAQVAEAIFSSTEYQRDLVAGWYTQLLERPADPNGLAHFAAQLASGERDEYVIAEMLASDEYFAKANT